jgi:hypothetical protein
MAARQREIRLPANAKACDVRANAAFRISTLHRRCLQDVITGILACILAVKLIRHTAFRHLQSRPIAIGRLLRALGSTF